MAAFKIDGRRKLSGDQQVQRRTRRAPQVSAVRWSARRSAPWLWGGTKPSTSVPATSRRSRRWWSRRC